MDEPEDRWELGSRGRVAGGDELVRAAKADGELRGDLARSHAGAEATGHLLRAVVTGGEAEQPGVARDPQAVVTRIDVARAHDRGWPSGSSHGTASAARSVPLSCSVR